MFHEEIALKMIEPSLRASLRSELVCRCDPRAEGWAGLEIRNRVEAEVMNNPQVFFSKL